MRRVANGHPSALVMERCQPGSRFAWGRVPEREKIPADWVHTCIHTHARFPLRSAFDQTRETPRLYSSSVWLSAPSFLHNNSRSHLPLASRLSKLCSTSLLQFYFFVFRKFSISAFLNLSHSFNAFFSILHFLKRAKRVSGFGKPANWWNFWCSASASVQISTSLNIPALRQNQQKQLC